jgi:uncharacterized protein YndB with AHSA1/START domain
VRIQYFEVQAPAEASCHGSKVLSSFRTAARHNFRSVDPRLPKIKDGTSPEYENPSSALICQVDSMGMFQHRSSLVSASRISHLATNNPSHKPSKPVAWHPTCPYEIRAAPTAHSQNSPQQGGPVELFRLSPVNQIYKVWDVELRTEITADPHRIFHALTLAEYLETWLCFPNANHFGCIEVTQTAKQFAIDVNRLRKASGFIKIRGEHLVREPNEIVFTWVKQCGISIPETIVCIKLAPNHRATDLKLSHIGFVDYKERMWHEDMWRASFEKLRQILC